jgi:hypothetical protein
LHLILWLLYQLHSSGVEKVPDLEITQW